MHAHAPRCPAAASNMGGVSSAADLLQGIQSLADGAKRLIALVRDAVQVRYRGAVHCGTQVQSTAVQMRYMMQCQRGCGSTCVQAHGCADVQPLDSV